MDSNQLMEICIAALKDATVSRGAHRGQLKKACPKSRTDGAAAWQAVALHSNPHKCSVGAIVMFSDRQRAIFNAIDKALEGKDARGLDRDRVALERLGAW
jgi:hypothetical protein